MINQNFFFKQCDQRTNLIKLNSIATFIILNQPVCKIGMFKEIPQTYSSAFKKINNDSTFKTHSLATGIHCAIIQSLMHTWACTPKHVHTYKTERLYGNRRKKLKLSC